jgi:hypothetical protein
MRIPIFARGANPAVDRPLTHKGREQVKLLLAANMVVMLSRRAAQFTCDRESYIEPAVRRLDEAGYDGAVRRGRKLVWVPTEMTWQMRPSYGSIARHFRASRMGLRFAPNKSSSPRDHQAVTR